MAPSYINTKPAAPARTSSDCSSVSGSPTTSSPRVSSEWSRSRFMCKIRNLSTPSPSEEKTFNFRTDSSLSTSTSSSRPKTQKRYSGTTMQVGRNSNDWLFGGFSITDTVRKALSDEKH